MTKQVKIIFAYFILLAALSLGATKLLADCTGCGDDGHQVCPIEKKHKHVTYMKEEHKEICEELGIDARGILHGIKLIAQTAEKDDTKLKALFKLSDILDLEDKTTTSVQQVSGAVFQGFSKDELKGVERKELLNGEE